MKSSTFKVTAGWSILVIAFAVIGFSNVPVAHAQIAPNTPINSQTNGGQDFCPAGSTQVTVDPTNQNGTTYTFNGVSGTYRVEIYSPVAASEATYTNYTWANNNADPSVARIHGGAVYMLTNKSPTYYNAPDGLRIADADYMIGSENPHMDPPYNSDPHTTVANEARGDYVTLNLTTGETLNFVVDAVSPYFNKDTGALHMSICSNSATPICTPNTNLQCSGNSVYNYDSCGNQGSLYLACSGNQTCSNGACVTGTQTCTQNSYERCNGNNLYWFDSCGNQGGIAQTCANGCSGSACIGTTNTCTQNSYEQCNGNNLYWYDSCGTQGSLAQTCTNGCSGNICNNTNTGNYLNVSTQVRDLTSGNTSFSNSVSANPGDVLLFLITVQSNQSINNITLRDNLPAGLNYQGQLVVSGTGNYSGDPINGLSISNINPNQTVTVSFQAQVTGSGYAGSTLTNNINITTPNGTQTSSATVYVGGQVLGAATYTSTGLLTNNFLMDSFLLPLALALLGAWMYSMGMFLPIQKWIDSKRNKSSGYKAEKTLEERILSIKQAEQN